MNDSIQRHILVTGAAGRIGTSFYEQMRGTYRFTLTDRDRTLLDRPLAPGDASLLLDIVDLKQLVAALETVDTVVHLAADPSPAADFEASLLANNIQGAYNVFSAAAAAGCRRVVLASSVHAVAGHPDTEPVAEDWPVWPLNMYGVSKCFGEATGRKFSSTDGLSCIAIRIGAFDNPEWMTGENAASWRKSYISPRDLNQLISRSIDAPPAIAFAIVHGVSNNREKRLSIEGTRQLLGYAPIDDGFVRVM